MKNLSTLTSESPENLYLSIASSKYNPCKDILFESIEDPNNGNCIQNRVLGRYKEYQDNCYQLENLSPRPFTLIEKKCLTNCYSSETHVSDWLLTEITNVQDQFNKDKCPYCGTNSPTTVDHYLPKELFPEFSVMSYNLIPCCSDCNLLKGTKWKDETTGKRMFIHFYFDEIPNDIFIKADISIASNNAPLVIFSLCPSISLNPFYDIVKTHYKELNVLERMEYKVSTFVSEKLQFNKKCMEFGMEEADLKRMLLIDINTIERNHGKNYWKAAVCRGIMECDIFFR